MPKTIITWTWDEAFSKYGFGDGDSWSGTNIVAEFLKSLGCSVECDGWGMHNYIIQSVEWDGTLYDDFGDYGDDARDRLPPTLVTQLDEHFGEDYTEESSGY